VTPSVDRLVPPLLPILCRWCWAASVLAMVFAWFFPTLQDARPAPVARFTDITKESGHPVCASRWRADTLTTLAGA